MTMTEGFAALIRQREMDEDDARSEAACRRWLHCVHKEACDRAYAKLEGAMETFDALRCEECDAWEEVR